MPVSDSSIAQPSSPPTPQDTGFSPWKRLKTKRISYLTLPLLAMATVTEFVILATGWKYQQVVCLPQGMGVTFLGIGPIGATILACELLKLPLAIWTASRYGWQKAFMLLVGLPLICVLTFQLVKDMAVYEMGVAMAPAGQMLEKAMVEETKIRQLNGDLVAIEAKRTDRDHRLAELAAKQAKAKAEMEDSLKRNDTVRQDAISLTDYQKKELADVESRQYSIINQFNTDTVQLNKEIAGLEAQRETEVARASKWNAEEARIENEYKAKMAEYSNKKAAYDKAKSDYDNANFLKRQLMKEPESPGVPPEREVNKLLKPTLVADLDAQIKGKRAELQAVANKRRDRLAQVDADARRIREQYDQRSTTKREDADKKREELTTALAALAKEEKAEHEQLDKEFEGVVQKVDGIRAEIDAARKRAEGYYEAREASIRKTQVHRIATTVEIVRGLIKGERPMSIKATAKERGDILTDQISMVRIWVYPVLAFIVAFLPTLMVEIGFSTVFQPDQPRPSYRLGFLGRRMHELYIRAGRQKIFRAERIAREASAKLAARDQALAAANAVGDTVLIEKESQLKAAQDALSAEAAQHQAELERLHDERAEQMKQREAEWAVKLAAMADSLNRTLVEKDALRDLQKSEIERQIQTRQNSWSDRLTQLRQDLDQQRASAEAERTALMQENHRKLMEVTEECKTQVIQARRQLADAELGAVEKTAKLSNELKDALRARDAAEAQLKQQSDTLGSKLAETQEDAAREREKAALEAKQRSDRQQMEFQKALRQREEDFQHRLQQAEQEFSLALDSRLAEEKSKAEQEARLGEAELTRQFEARAREVDERWKQALAQREQAAQTRLQQREQQFQASADASLRDAQTQAEQEFSLTLESRLAEEKSKAEQEARLREADLTRQFEARAQDVDVRWKQDLAQRELAAQTRLKQREQQFQAQADARLRDAQTQAEQELRRRELEFERELEAQVREADARSKQELHQKELAFQAKLKQREQELTTRADTRERELQSKWAADLRARQEVWTRQAETDLHAAESRLAQQVQQKDEAAQARTRQREQELSAELNAQAEARLRDARAQWETESQEQTRAAINVFKGLLARAEKERDAALRSASEATRHAQDIQSKLSEASSLLTGGGNGRSRVSSLPASYAERDWTPDETSS